MSNEQKEYDPPLSEIKAILKARGLSNIDLKHLDYETLRKMAGI